MGTQSKELEYIDSIVHKGEPSRQMKELRELLKGSEVPAQNIIEFFIPEEDFPKLRDAMLKEKGGDTYPFRFKEKVNGKMHIIVFYNIKNVAEIFESLKKGESSANFSSLVKSIKKMEFENTVSFEMPPRKKPE